VGICQPVNFSAKQAHKKSTTHAARNLITTERAM